MFDYEDIYSLLFTGIIILFLFLMSNSIILKYYESEMNALTGLNLMSKALNYSILLYNSNDLTGLDVLDLELNDSVNKVYNNSFSLPCLIFRNGSFHTGRVLAYE